MKFHFTEDVCYTSINKSLNTIQFLNRFNRKKMLYCQNCHVTFLHMFALTCATYVDCHISLVLSSLTVIQRIPVK